MKSGFALRLSIEVKMMADRLDMLRKCAVICPLCKTSQVQIISQRPPATWRCRRCRYKFEFEPQHSHSDLNANNA